MAIALSWRPVNDLGQGTGRCRGAFRDDAVFDGKAAKGAADLFFGDGEELVDVPGDEVDGDRAGFDLPATRRRV